MRADFAAQLRYGQLLSRIEMGDAAAQAGDHCVVIVKLCRSIDIGSWAGHMANCENATSLIASPVSSLVRPVHSASVAASSVANHMHTVHSATRTIQLGDLATWVGAFGTIAVAVVAVYPIWREHRSRIARAKLLAHFLSIPLNSLQSTLQACVAQLESLGKFDPEHESAKIQYGLKVLRRYCNRLVGDLEALSTSGAADLPSPFGEAVAVSIGSVQAVVSSIKLAAASFGDACVLPATKESLEIKRRCVTLLQKDIAPMIGRVMSILTIAAGMREITSAAPKRIRTFLRIIARPRHQTFGPST